MTTPFRILWVDDNLDFLNVAMLWLTSKGYAVVGARTGQEALRIVASEPVDLVFLDVDMPRMDGVEVLAKIRQLKKDLSVILVTGYPEHTALERLQGLGIAGFFSKEGGFDKLTEILEPILTSHHKSQH